MAPAGQCSARGGYLAFIGRISPEKRPDRAIEIAQAAIAAQDRGQGRSADEVYFRERIAPLLDTKGVEFVGEIDERQRPPSSATRSRCSFPIDWPEPFGLVMIEAMACGTPVLAFNCGSVPEVIDPGVTGYIVKSEEEAALAISRLDRLDRDLIRREFKQRFSVGIMAQNYVRLYERLLCATEEILQLPDVDLLPDGVKHPPYDTIGLPSYRANGTRAVAVAGE